MIKSSLGRKDSFLLYSFEITTHQDRNSRQELGAKTEAETMEGCCLLACSVWFFLILHDHLPRSGSTFHINLQWRKCHRSLQLPTGQSDRAFTQLRFLLLRWLSLCQVDKTTQNQSKYFPFSNINPTEHSLYYINHFYFWLNKSISCYTEWLSSSFSSRFIVWHLH